MLNIDFKVRSTGEICGFHIFGHSGYAEIGKDIVCAAVSSVAYMVVNTMTDVINIPVSVSIDDGEMIVDINDKYVLSCRDLVEGFKLHVISLENMYPKNIKVNYTEV